MRADGCPPLNQVRRVLVRGRVADFDRRFMHVPQICKRDKSAIHLSKLQFIYKVTVTIQPHVQPHVRTGAAFRRIGGAPLMLSSGPKRAQTPITVSVWTCSTYPRVYPTAKIHDYSSLSSNGVQAILEPSITMAASSIASITIHM